MKVSLNTQIIIGAVFGIFIGLFVSAIGPESGLGANILYMAGIIGKVFVSLLKMILIPLVFVSITVGIANLREHAQMNRVWKISLVYYFSTTALSILLGLIVVNIFKPGVGLEIAMFRESMSQFTLEGIEASEFIENFISNLFINPFQAMAQGMVLPTIVFALFMGIALVFAGDQKAKVVLGLFTELFDLIMMIVNWIMKVLPIGIMALLIKLVATQDPAIFMALGKFVVVVLGATLFHGFVTLPLLLTIFAKRDLGSFYISIREALITAFSTSSSSATLPITYRCAKDNLKVDKDVAGFVLPLGATINMDGTALYEAVAAIFIANLVGIDLSIAQQVIVFLMAMMASIGAPGIPSAGMVTMIMVLQSVNLPVEAIAILYPIDRILDAFRTMVNVKGDLVGSLIVDRYTT